MTRRMRSSRKQRLRADACRLDRRVAWPCRCETSRRAAPHRANQLEHDPDTRCPVSRATVCGVVPYCTAELLALARRRIAGETMARLLAPSWPGNVRELKNVAERAVVRSRSGTVTPADLPREFAAARVLPSAAAQGVRGKPKADLLLDRMLVHGESFWTAVYKPFMSRRRARRSRMRRVPDLGQHQAQAAPQRKPTAPHPLPRVRHRHS